MTLRRKRVGMMVGCLLGWGSFPATACKPHTIIELPPEPAPAEPVASPGEPEPNASEPEPNAPEPGMEVEPAPEPMEPAPEPTVEPAAEPAMEPAAEPAVEPAGEPIAEPTAEPAVEPVAQPTAEPAVEPTVEPDEPRPDSGGRPLSALRHRYSFSGNGDVALDEIGAADGLVFGGAALSGTGFVSLDGIDDYVQLPDGLISSLEATTIMVWASWEGTACWERLFDFGNNLVIDGRVEADTSWFMTPHLCLTDARPAIRLEFRTTPTDTADAYLRFTATGPDVLAAGPHQYAATLNVATGRMRLFVDGVEVGSSPIVDEATGASKGLADVRDLSNWLGRSQYLADAFFLGSFDEFRIYAVALTPAEIQSSFDAGPDTVVEVD